MLGFQTCTLLGVCGAGDVLKDLNMEKEMNKQNRMLRHSAIRQTSENAIRFCVCRLSQSMGSGLMSGLCPQ